MQKAVLTIAFDDGYLDTYRYAISYLDKIGIKCTFAVPVKLIGNTCEKRPVLNWRHLKKMKANGHEIASHALYHRRLIREPEIVRSKQILQNYLGIKISSFVYPYISKRPNKTIRDIVENNYSSSRISKNFSVFNRLPVKNSYNLKGFCIMRNHPLPYLIHQIDKAVKTKSWLIEVFHLVGKKNTKSAHRNKPYRFFMHIDDFKRHIDTVLSKNIEILTQKKVVRRYVH
ncbi:MAG: polysaccharide deacetylase family protein [Candidatus Omnitrophica bacterium]|nr:polysaccharide deacetylase family protein [Candidatus Omnitrophota bacterium]